MSVDAVIGLDFGTSSTKVSIQLPYEVGAPVYAVPFGAGPEEFPYLQPGILWRSPIGNLSLEAHADFKPLSDLKMRLLGGSSFSIKWGEAENVCAAFLGLVLRQAKHWMAESQAGVLRGRSVRWSLNIGMPASNYNDTRLKNLYLELAHAAWRLSESPPITVYRASEVSRDPLADIEIDVVPEVVAAAIGYARSSERRSGLHVLVDVGAATVDVCGFMLHDNGMGDLYSILVAEVLPLGAIALHNARVQALAAGITAPATAAWSNRLLQPVPQHNQPYLTGVSLEGLTGSIGSADEEFEESVAIALRRVLHGLRRQWNPNALEWTTSLPVFLCGGAGEARFYSHRVGETVRRFAGESWRGRAEAQAIPRPGGLRAERINPAQVGRLAVSWGLSHPRLDIGDVKTPDELGEVEPIRIRPWTEFIGAEQV